WRDATAPAVCCPLSLHDALPISDNADADVPAFARRAAQGLGLFGGAHALCLRSILRTGTCCQSLRSAASSLSSASPSPISRQLRSEEHTSELQSRFDLVCRLLLE